MYKSFKSSLFAFSGLVVLIASVIVPSTASASVGCSPANTVMYVVAHEDDALLFQNPDMQNDISAGKCVSTIFLTAGEAGSNLAYMTARENGAKAASALMAGVADVWTLSDAGISGHSVALYTLDANPKITLVFFRLPDGGVPGMGFGTYGNQSLQKLYQGAISTMTTVDGLSTYSRTDLVNALLTLMVNMNPSRINTQDFIGVFGDSDHSDHHATAFFVKDAQNGYNTPHSLYSYIDYDTQYMAETVTGDDLVKKENAFFAYTPHDRDACQNVIQCAGYYLDWLKRQYINGHEDGGDTCSNIEGRQSSVPEGMTLSDGQCVPVVVAPSCTTEISSIEVVSDETNTVSSGGNAVATFIPSSWTASIPGATWIWNAFYVTDPQVEEILTFTKEITVTGTPTSASITIASDDNYRASINGNEFAVVSDLNNFESGNEDTYNVSALLHEGTNSIVITVRNIGQEGITNPEWNPAGLKYKLTITKNSCTNTPPQVCPEGTIGIYPACTPVSSTPISTGGGAGSADSPYWGCTNASASNFNSLANRDDGSCVLPQVTTSGAVGGSGTTTGEVLGASTSTPELPLPAGCTEYIHSYLGQGKKNDKEDVVRLQTFLNETMGTNIPTSGYFGSITKNLVKKFQVKYHAEIIKPWVDAGYKGKDIENGTGYVYKTTKREINLIKCSTLDIPVPDLASDIK